MKNHSTIAGSTIKRGVLLRGPCSPEHANPPARPAARPAAQAVNLRDSTDSLGYSSDSEPAMSGLGGAAATAATRRTQLAEYM